MDAQDIQGIGGALQGMGAWFGGQGPNYMYAKSQEEANRQEMLEKRRRAMAIDTITAGRMVAAGMQDQALKLLDNRLELGKSMQGMPELGGDFSDTQRMRDAIASGDVEGIVSELPAFEMQARMQWPDMFPEQDQAKYAAKTTNFLNGAREQVNNQGGVDFYNPQGQLVDPTDPSFAQQRQEAAASEQARYARVGGGGATSMTPLQRAQQYRDSLPEGSQARQEADAAVRKMTQGKSEKPTDTYRLYGDITAKINKSANIPRYQQAMELVNNIDFYGSKKGGTALIESTLTDLAPNKVRAQAEIMRLVNSGSISRNVSDIATKWASGELTNATLNDYKALATAIAQTERQRLDSAINSAVKWNGSAFGDPETLRQRLSDEYSVTGAVATPEAVGAPDATDDERSALEAAGFKWNAKTGQWDAP